MELGIHVVSFKGPDGPPGIASSLAKVATAAEDAGCSSLSVMDHFFQLEFYGLEATDPMLEGYATPWLFRRFDHEDSVTSSRHRCDLSTPGHPRENHEHA